MTRLGQRLGQRLEGKIPTTAEKRREEKRRVILYYYFHSYCIIIIRPFACMDKDLACTLMYTSFSSAISMFLSQGHYSQ